MKTKLFISFLLMFFLSTFIVNCGDKGGTKPPKRPPVSMARYTIGMLVPVGKTTVAPEWTDMEGGITSFGGEKYLWIKGEGDSKRRSIARRTAIGAAQGRMAESVSVVIASQFAQAWEALGVGDKEEIEQVKQGLIATKSRVSVRGFKLLRSHKEQVAPIRTLRADGQPGQLGKVRWRYTVMMALPYKRYKRIRDRTVRRMKKKVKPNSRQKKLLRKAEAQLKKLDRNPPELAVPSKTTTPRPTASVIETKAKSSV